MVLVLMQAMGLLENTVPEGPPSGDPPVANFTASPLTGNGPLFVTFTNTSTDGDSYLWNFGDGNTSTATSPTHTYNVFGSVTVTLTATNAFGVDTEVKTNYITITDPNPPPPGSLIRRLVRLTGARRILLSFRQRKTGP